MLIPSDHDLMERVQRGDSSAFDVLFERYECLVSRRLLSVVRDPSTSEDLLQEVFLRLWTRAGQWQGRGTVKSWLMRLTTNLALDYVRVRKRREAQGTEASRTTRDEADAGMDGLADPDATTPDLALEQAERWAEMWALVNALPDRQREVVRLIHEHEMDVQEVAELLDIPAGTVKSRLFYARRTLADEWGGSRD